MLVTISDNNNNRNNCTVLYCIVLYHWSEPFWGCSPTKEKQNAPIQWASCAASPSPSIHPSIPCFLLPAEQRCICDRGDKSPASSPWPGPRSGLLAAGGTERRQFHRPGGFISSQTPGEGRRWESPDLWPAAVTPPSISSCQPVTPALCCLFASIKGLPTGAVLAF